MLSFPFGRFFKNIILGAFQQQGRNGCFRLYACTACFPGNGLKTGTLNLPYQDRGAELMKNILEKLNSQQLECLTAVQDAAGKLNGLGSTPHTGSPARNGQLSPGMIAMVQTWLLDREQQQALSDNPEDGFYLLASAQLLDNLYPGNPGGRADRSGTGDSVSTYPPAGPGRGRPGPAGGQGGGGRARLGPYHGSHRDYPGGDPVSCHAHRTGLGYRA